MEETKTDTETTKTDTLTVEELLAMAKEAGAKHIEQKSFHKLVSSEENRKAIYVAKSKRGLTRVDVAGFVPPESPAIKQLTKEDATELKLGAVRGQIFPKELRCGTKKIVAAFKACVAVLLEGTEGFKLAPKAVEEVEAAAAADEYVPCSQEPFPARHGR